MKIETKCDNCGIDIILAKKDILPLKKHEKRNIAIIRAFSKNKGIDYFKKQELLSAAFNCPICNRRSFVEVQD